MARRRRKRGIGQRGGYLAPPADEEEARERVNFLYPRVDAEIEEVENPTPWDSLLGVVDGNMARRVQILRETFVPPARNAMRIVDEAIAAGRWIDAYQKLFVAHAFIRNGASALDALGVALPPAFYPMANLVRQADAAWREFGVMGQQFANFMDEGNRDLREAGSSPLLWVVLGLGLLYFGAKILD